MNLYWKQLLLPLVAVAVLAASSTSRAAPPAPDNTAVNARDVQGGPLTPIDQSNDPKDLELTRQIRKAITVDADLSVDAKNIKIITVHGMVSLRGPVRSEDEREKISAKAAGLAGADHVHNQLEIIQAK